MKYFFWFLFAFCQTGIIIIIDFSRIFCLLSEAVGGGGNSIAKAIFTALLITSFLVSATS